jgi:CRP-like cAMP-binding protein
LSKALQTLIRKLREHTRLTAEDLATISALPRALKQLTSNEDVVRQGDRPDVSAVVISGMLARYHLLADGARQYLSFHMAGDMPDSQALFIEQMDHAVCAAGPVVIALIPHKDLLAAFDRRPSVGFAIWRETLIDAAIFREAITNNSARAPSARMSHLFCELYYRARASGLTEGGVMSLPISLVQLGEALGVSIASVNRTLQELRATRAVEFHRGKLHVRNWEQLVKLGQFNPNYLHQRKPSL